MNTTTRTLTHEELLTLPLTVEPVVVRVGWSAGAKTHLGSRAVRTEADGTRHEYISHTVCGTRGGTYGLGVAKVLAEGTSITCIKCAEEEAPEEVWETGTVSMASGARREAIRLNGEVQVKTIKGDGWFVSKDAKVAASFKA